MKLDFTISFGDVIAIITVCGTVAGSAWAVIRKFNQILNVFREYPPHRHTPLGEIVYPTGVKPGTVELQGLAAKRS
jgi:hypothetical protein